ncbi:MAG: cytidylate kinase-like family protein [Chloroflexi bacterium]|nr:cytidylate kinase-like family protein [Chloroflexota bacterium]
MKATVITVSRQKGSGGNPIALNLAQTLGYRFVDRESIHRAALEAGVPEVALRELEYEGQRDLIERILDRLKTLPPIPATVQPSQLPREPLPPSLGLPFGSLISAGVPPFASTMEDYVRMLNLVMSELARQGQVVIAGRGGQALLRGWPGAFHLLVVAPFPQRVAAVMAGPSATGIATEAQARARVRASDEAHRDFLRRYHHIEWLQPLHYDLVLNTAQLSPAAAAEVLLAALERAKARPGG